jgi:hypothetical protein
LVAFDELLLVAEDGVFEGFVHALGGLLDAQQ